MTSRSLAGLLLLAACTQPAAEPAAEPTVAAPDTAAVLAELQAASERYQNAMKAGNVSEVAATFTEDAVAEYQGFPSAIGRAAIESVYTGYLAENKVNVAEITLNGVRAMGPNNASGLGTYHTFMERGGKPVHEWWRFVAGYVKEADGQWRTQYIMAFPDSTK